MKLHEIPRQSKILLPILSQKSGVSTNEMCLFHHIDGMYSYITLPDGEVVHLGASTEVKLVDDHYELDQTV